MWGRKIRHTDSNNKLKTNYLIHRQVGYHQQVGDWGGGGKKFRLSDKVAVHRMTMIAGRAACHR